MTELNINQLYEETQTLLKHYIEGSLSEEEKKEALNLYTEYWMADNMLSKELNHAIGCMFDIGVPEISGSISKEDAQVLLTKLLAEQKEEAHG